jgi:hypothetical protein
VQLLAQQPLAADAVQRLQHQSAQQPLRRHRQPAPSAYMAANFSSMPRKAWFRIARISINGRSAGTNAAVVRVVNKLSCVMSAPRIAVAPRNFVPSDINAPDPVPMTRRDREFQKTARALHKEIQTPPVDLAEAPVAEAPVASAAL